MREINERRAAFLKSCGMSTHEYTEEEAFDILFKEKVALLLEKVELQGKMPEIILSLYTLKDNGISDGEQRREIEKIFKTHYTFETGKRTGNIIRVILVNKITSKKYQKEVKLV